MTTVYTPEEKQEIAMTIINQMGGLGRLSAMIALHSAMSLEAGVSFQFKGCRKANKCLVTLGADDLYTMEIGKLDKNLDWVVLYKESGLYWDMLKPEFERGTGLYLPL